MQFLRALIMLAGVAIAVVGLYLLVIGLGAPIAIQSIGLGGFKASLNGIGAGFVVALVGCLIVFLAMKFFKREEKRTTTTTVVREDAGGTTTTTTVHEVFETQMTPPDF